MAERVSAWVESAQDQRNRELRQAVHTVLIAMADFRQAGLEVVMKGGILLAIEYASDRYTKDVDFSTSASVPDVPPEQFVVALGDRLAGAAERLEYGLDCRVQGHDLEPPGEDKTWPTLRIRVGYAPLQDTRRHDRLLRGQATNVLAVEISYSEIITADHVIEVGDVEGIHASTLVDLVAEKYRAMIQQPIRKRVRRQDSYDLYSLLEKRASELLAQRPAVLEALRRKAAARIVTVTRESLQDPEVERRSREEYPRLADEIVRPLPEFERVYEAVRDYYEGLPW